MSTAPFSPWMRLKLNSNSPRRRMRIGSMIVDNWRCLLEDDPEVTHIDQLVGFYYDGMDNMAFVLRWSEDFIPSSMHQHQLSLPLPVKHFMVGAHSRCLSEWLHITNNCIGFLHHVRIIHATRGQRCNIIKQCAFIHVICTRCGIPWSYSQGPHEWTHITY